MYITKNNGFGLLNEILDDVFAPEIVRRRGISRPYAPSANIKETEEAYWIELALAGYTKKDIQIRLEKDDLLISSEGKNDEGEDTSYSRKEFGLKAFKKRFHLPKNANKEAIDAKFKNGVLILKIGKLEEDNLNKTIDIA